MGRGGGQHESAVTPVPIIFNAHQGCIAIQNQDDIDAAVERALGRPLSASLSLQAGVM
jgi:hypothetical protein